MTTTIILRVHTDFRLGLGHVARAMAIADPLKALGINPLLAVSGDQRARALGGGVHPLTGSPFPFETLDLGEDPLASPSRDILDQASVVFLDQWDVSPGQVQACRPCRVAVMEDDGDAHEGADLLFQPFLEGVSWPASPVRMAGGRKVKPHETQRGECRVLRGAAYIVVGPEAGSLRPRREPLQPLAVHKLLASFGGADGPGLAQRAHDILRLLVREHGWAGTCTLLAPNGVQGDPVPGVTVTTSVPNLTRRILDQDALWCAAGVTLAEAVCMGVPAAAWGQNERQTGMIQDVAQANGCLSLGLGPEADPRATAEALARWLGPEGQDSRQEQTRDGMALVDGGGAARIAQELAALARG